MWTHRTQGGRSQPCAATIIIVFERRMMLSGTGDQLTRFS
jgi:hypothetical protein